MESIDYWDDSQAKSCVQFDEAMQMFVADLIGVAEVEDDAPVVVSAVDSLCGMDLIVEDTYDREDDSVFDDEEEEVLSHVAKDLIVEDIYDREDVSVIHHEEDEVLCPIASEQGEIAPKKILLESSSSSHNQKDTAKEKVSGDESYLLQLDSRKLSLNLKSDLDEPATFLPVVKKRNGCLRSQEQNKDEEEISESSLNKLVGAADVYNLEEMEPPSTVTCDLRPFQKQDLNWMFEAEKGIDVEKAAKILPNLNLPLLDDVLHTTTFLTDKDFDLNKLPIRGMFGKKDPFYEENFIKMLRLLVPDFY